MNKEKFMSGVITVLFLAILFIGLAYCIIQLGNSTSAEAPMPDETATPTVAPVETAPPEWNDDNSVYWQTNVWPQSSMWF